MGARAPIGRAIGCRALPPALPLAGGFSRTGKKLRQVEEAILRLVERHGCGVWGDNAIDLRLHDNPDGKYLIKGGGPKVWKRFGLRKQHRRVQGLIFGKRCGTTENIGPAARSAKRSQQHHQINRG